MVKAMAVRETTSQRLVTSGGVYVRTSRVYEYQPGEGNSLQVSRIRFRFCRLNNRARRLPNHDNIILGCSGNLPRILGTPLKVRWTTNVSTVHEEKLRRTILSIFWGLFFSDAAKVPYIHATIR